MIKQFLFLLCTLLCLNTENFAQEKADLQIPGEVLIQLNPQTNISDFLARVNASPSIEHKLQLLKSLGTKHQFYLLGFDDEKMDQEKLLSFLNSRTEVLAAQFNYYLEFRAEPDDPRFSEQWDMERIEAPKVWDVTTGGLTATGDTIVVAILDSGFDYEHEDLLPNVWRNHAEIPNDGQDNDNNGYIDDYYGWYFAENSDNHPPSSHGLSVAGIIGAKGNNGIGVTGINWNIQLMLLTTTTVDQIVDAYEYVIEQREKYNNSNGAEGAFVVATNASFGQSRKFCEEQPIWGGMYDLMGEVGVLTGAAPPNSHEDVDELGDMPTTCTSNYIMTVLNTNEADQKYSNSAFGLTSIDLGAPGHESFTIRKNNAYGTFGGTSAAAPHLTGSIALLYSIPCETFAQSALNDPAGTALTVREAILTGVDPLDNLSNYAATGGRLNVFNSMNILQEECGGTTGELEIMKLYPNPVYDRIIIEYETPDYEDYQLRVFNAIGQMVYRETISPSRFSVKTHQIAVNNWTGGTYFLYLEKENGDYVLQKFVKI